MSVPKPGLQAPHLPASSFFPPPQSPRKSSATCPGYKRGLQGKAQPRHNGLTGRASLQQPLCWDIQTNVAAGKHEKKSSPRHMKRWLKLFLTFPIDGKIKPFMAETAARAMGVGMWFFSLIVSVSIQSRWSTIFYLFPHVFVLVQWHKLTLSFSRHHHGKIRHGTLALTSNPADLGSSLWRGKTAKKVKEHFPFCQDLFSLKD